MSFLKEAVGAVSFFFLYPVFPLWSVSVFHRIDFYQVINFFCKGLLFLFSMCRPGDFAWA